MTGKDKQMSCYSFVTESGCVHPWSSPLISRLPSSNLILIQNAIVIHSYFVVKQNMVLKHQLETKSKRHTPYDHIQSRISSVSSTYCVFYAEKKKKKKNSAAA